jgi:hypothetical protein
MLPFVAHFGQQPAGFVLVGSLIVAVKNHFAGSGAGAYKEFHNEPPVNLLLQSVTVQAQHGLEVRPSNPTTRNQDVASAAPDTSTGFRLLVRIKMVLAVTSLLAQYAGAIKRKLPGVRARRLQL